MERGYLYQYGSFMVFQCFCLNVYYDPFLLYTVTNPSQITGGVGTMKRNRQLRELVDNFNKDYNDDYFDSTPLKLDRGGIKVRVYLFDIIT